MLYLFIGLSAAVLFIDLCLILLWLTNYKDQKGGIDTTPFVSIIIAARNEENNLGDCLEALMEINYPADKFEVLVGDDMSDDKTGEVAEAYAARYPQISNFTIYKKTIKGNGKANVLAQLIKKAKSEYLFITDADIMVPKEWINSMLLGMKEDVAVVTGTSVVTGNGLLAYMQQIDWLFATGMLKVISDLNIPVTSMGNNMLFRKSVYEEIGGYEALPFSVTEDLELFNHIKAKYQTINLFNPQVLNESKPQSSLTELLIQRKRWLRGAFELPFIMIVLLLMQASFFAVIIALIIINPSLGLTVLAAKFVLRFTFLSLVVRKLNNTVNIFGSFIFEFYTAFFSIASLFYYFASGKVEWKGRKY